MQDLQGIRQGFDLHILDLNQSVIQEQIDETVIPAQSLPALPIQETPAE